MFYGGNKGPTFHYSLCLSFCLRRPGLTGEGIINFYILILYFIVHFIKNAYFASFYIVQSSDIIYKSASVSLKCAFFPFI